MVALTIGDPVPWFTLPSTSNPQFRFDTVGGHRVILFFFGSASHPNSAQAIAQFLTYQAELAQLTIPFFGVSIDPRDQSLTQQIQDPTYCKFLWDFEGAVSRRHGACHTQNNQLVYVPQILVLDETLRVLQNFAIAPENPVQSVETVLSFVRTLPPLPPPQVATPQAPVLLIPRVLEPDFCAHLIRLYEADGGEDSGFMRERDGKTIEAHDYSFKVRRDLNLENVEGNLIQQVNERVIRRVKPEIEKVYQFAISRFERHIIGCYEAESGGFFKRHRDNTTRGTAHRRFAMTINLNTGDYEGGYLCFPEYGSHLFRPGVGEAIIFSCSLMHEVTPITQGRRFALLSFFYNDADAALREQNRQYLETATLNS